MSTMRHDYHEMIDVLSQSINLMESMPISSEASTEEFEPIFADDFSTQTTNEEIIISTELNQHLARSTSNSSSDANIDVCSYKRENNITACSSVVQINNLAQNNSNVNQIHLSSDSGNEQLLSNPTQRICEQSLGSPFLNMHNHHNEDQVGRNFQMRRDGSSTSSGLEPNNIECGCLKKRIIKNSSFSQNQNNKNTLQKNFRSHALETPLNSFDPLPGPSGLNQTTQTSHTNLNIERTDRRNLRSGVSDILTAPELQLDFFSDSSNDSNENETNTVLGSHTGSPPSVQIMNSSRTNNRDGIFLNRSYDRPHNARDFSQSAFFSRSSISSAGPMRSNNRQSIGRNENIYRRRFYHNSSQSSTYIPHQRLWYQQHHFQEMYRRFMTNNHDERRGQYHSPNSTDWESNRTNASFDPYSYIRLNFQVAEDMYFPSTIKYLNRGASQEIIEKHTLCYKFLTINESFNNEKCSICLSHFEEDTFVRRLPCLHFYHCECIEYWLRLNSTCPICRIDIQKNIQ